MERISGEAKPNRLQPKTEQKSGIFVNLRPAIGIEIQLP